MTHSEMNSGVFVDSEEFRNGRMEVRIKANGNSQKAQTRHNRSWKFLERWCRFIQSDVETSGKFSFS